MKKRTTLLAAIMALTCVCGTASTAANAEEALVLTRDEEGNITISLEEAEPAVIEEDEVSYLETQPRILSVVQATHGEGDQLDLHTETIAPVYYIITDGTELPLWHRFQNPTTGRDSVYYDLCVESAQWEEYHPTNEEELLASYGKNARMYRWAFGSFSSCSPNTVYTLLTEEPHILNIYHGVQVIDTIGTVQALVLNVNYCDSADEIYAPYEERLRNGEETVQITKEDQEKINNCIEVYRQEVFGELYDELKAFNEERETWIWEFGDWRVSVDYANMTPQERAESREAAGIASEWEMFRKAMDIRSRINERWESYCKENGMDPSETITNSLYDEACSIGFGQSTAVEAVSTYKAVSVWDSFMDADYSGEVNAADAQRILEYGASVGASSAAADLYYRDAFDMNFDGAVNAADASDLLIYLSEKGAGNTSTLEDYMKSKYVS